MLLTPDLFTNYGMMNVQFLAWMQRILDGAGWFTKITSDYREMDEQRKLVISSGGAKKSLHEVGQALDFRMPLANGGLDNTKIGMMTDAICLYRKGIQIEYEIDITPDDPHLHIGWYGYNGPLIVKPVCRHTGAK